VTVSPPLPDIDPLILEFSSFRAMISCSRSMPGKTVVFQFRARPTEAQNRMLFITLRCVQTNSLRNYQRQRQQEETKQKQPKSASVALQLISGHYTNHDRSLEKIGTFVWVQL
jgi:hypothetical protein